ncbi:condensin-2 complex subunit H2 isoform X2 [Gouania willdenowi]|uniref:Condensin-2 complex subunit H2 n=3 Tax=Gouania willdenowi TaxID=441366 RepID=A0A8C5HL61_GOUWI|nr:condensin-2 complex subunit H2 isoform X2 [Gouania willdenowi]XP_028307429.1 condensin-2 complex subunit H2 isoform X2 [Gouania willdenowi]XP_028307430.1 condensin-2 complex subunit H2 isoform X2 [Gouania willdenowi]XP_028307431.1 condensin-2 complex subunit H2 isoform X2 [Gouania willdenowi]
MMMMESTESRFAHLLQPIRELTKNWDIDVASELNDYLEELDEMCISLDGGRTNLNFAEAALLIQGSTCIYSKKVEMLHSLVYQTLDYINERNQKKNKQAAVTKDDEGAGSCDDEDGSEFTQLDLDKQDKSQASNIITSATVTPLPPESLIPPETHEKYKLPMISIKGDIPCSQKDFRINLFVPREDLILLAVRSADLPMLHHPHSFSGNQILQQQDADAEEVFVPMEESHMEPEVDEQTERHQAPTERRMIRERHIVEADMQRREAKAPPALSVWRTLLDPYESVGEDRAFKPGKCYKVPDGVDDAGKRKRRRGVGLQDFRAWFTGIYDPPEPKLKTGPMCTELNYIYLSNLKERVRTQRRICKRAGPLISEEELKRSFLQSEEQAEPEVLRDCGLPDDDTSDGEMEPFPDDVPLIVEDNFLPADNHRDDLSYEDLVKLRVEQLIVNSRGYTQETTLSKRVKDWEEKIRPVLTMKEQRTVFDIHDYSERIVLALGKVGHQRPFSSIVHGLDNYEVCKYLLASLQLANDYTVEVDQAPGLESSLDTLSLTLLSTPRATDRFKEMFDTI